MRARKALGRTATPSLLNDLTTAVTACCVAPVAAVASSGVAISMPPRSRSTVGVAGATPKRQCGLRGCKSSCDASVRGAVTVTRRRRGPERMPRSVRSIGARPFTLYKFELIGGGRFQRTTPSLGVEKPTESRFARRSISQLHQYTDLLLCQPRSRGGCRPGATRRIRAHPRGHKKT